MIRLASTFALVIFCSAVLAGAQEQPPPPPGERAAQDQPPPPPGERADRDRADRERLDRAPSPSDKFAPGPIQGPTQAPIQAPLPRKEAAVQAPQQAPLQAPMQKGPMHKGHVQKGGAYSASAPGDYRSYSYQPGFESFDSYGWYDDGGYYGGVSRMSSRPAWRNATTKATGRY